LTQPYKTCPQCQQMSALGDAFCGKCGHRYQTQYPYQTQIFAPPPPIAPYGQQAEQKSKIAAGLFALFLGGLGAHGFYTGNTAMGATLLAVTLISIPLLFFVIGFFSLMAVHTICLIQAILYLSASDYDFQRKYVIGKQWF